MTLIECSHCKKLFGVVHHCKRYYCPYCGTHDTVEDGIQEAVNG